jgi:hypothetical protein
MVWQLSSGLLPTVRQLSTGLRTSSGLFSESYQHSSGLPDFSWPARFPLLEIFLNGLPNFSCSASFILACQLSLYCKF